MLLLVTMVLVVVPADGPGMSTERLVRRIPWLVPALALLFLWPIAGVMAEEAVANVPADDVVAMTGEYYWEEGHNEGVLRKVLFTPTGAGTWDVAFHFSFRGRSHVYRGTAAGSLTQGALEGTIRNESEKRSFTFSGEFDDGTFQGTHREFKGSSSWSTGTMMLTR